MAKRWLLPESYIRGSLPSLKVFYSFLMRGEKNNTISRAIIGQPVNRHLNGVSLVG